MSLTGPKVLSPPDLPPVSHSPAGGPNHSINSDSHQVRLLLNSQNPKPCPRRTQVLAEARKPGLHWPCLLPGCPTPAPCLAGTRPHSRHPCPSQRFCPRRFLCWAPPCHAFLSPVNSCSSWKWHLPEASVHPRRGQASMPSACTRCFSSWHLSQWPLWVQGCACLLEAHMCQEGSSQVCDSPYTIGAAAPLSR